MTFFLPDWYARKLQEEPPGGAFLEGDPLGRHRRPRKRWLGMALWAVHDNGPAWAQLGGAPHLTRRSFAVYVIAPVLLLTLGLAGALAMVLA